MQGGGFFRLIENLLPDGGFETNPTTWTFVKTNSWSPTGSIVTASDAAWIKPHSGTRMLRFGKDTVTLSASFPVTPGATLTVGYWSNTYDSQRYATCSLLWSDGTESAKTNGKQNGQNWVYSEFTLTVPEGVTTAQVKFTGATSDVRVDDVTVIQTE